MTEPTTFDDALALRLRNCMHRLADAGAAFQIGKFDIGCDHLKTANVELTALRVAIDQALGPKKLPAAKRRR